MFDYADLERSKCYFKILQFLRIMHDSIEDMTRRLDEWPHEWKQQIRTKFVGRYCTQADFEDLLQDWSEIQGRIRQELQQIGRRIERKQAEIESLRDGVSAWPKMVTLPLR